MKYKIEDYIMLNTIESFGFKKLESLLNVFGDTSNILKAGRAELKKIT